MLIAQLSDLHIKTGGKLAYGIVDTARMLRDCVATLTSLNPLPDVVIITGDTVDYGQASEYELLKELLSPLSMPLHLVVGNHDDRSAMREAFSGPGFGYFAQCNEFVQYAVDLGGLRLIALDTVVPTEGRGKLCAKRLSWLDERLAEDNSPTLIAMHHPPFVTGIAHMDSVGLEGSQALEAIIARHSHVERLLCGHIHRSIQCRFGNTLASTCPSPAHQVAFDLSADGPDCFVMEPPGYQLHLWRDGRLVSHTCAIGEYAGPYRFRQGGVLID
jgi:3',5'-cyclic AMP phosphodiesterase CpdA